jgi:hypothetical protein
MIGMRIDLVALIARWLFLPGVILPSTAML